MTDTGRRPRHRVHGRMRDPPAASGPGTPSSGPREVTATPPTGSFVVPNFTIHLLASGDAQREVFASRRGARGCFILPHGGCGASSLSPAKAAVCRHSPGILALGHDAPTALRENTARATALAMPSYEKQACLFRFSELSCFPFRIPFLSYLRLVFIFVFAGTYSLSVSSERFNYGSTS